MKLFKIKEMSVEEMEKKVKDLKKELFMIRFKMLLKQVEKPVEMRNIRRDIRRMETLIREKRAS
jgi:large subunit ribosomal protein L29